MDRPKYYSRDRSFVNKKMSEELVKAYGTPLFVYDSKTVHKQAERVRQAFSWNPGFAMLFPVRIQNNPHMLRVIHQAGCDVQCCNGVELRLAQMAGIPGEDIVYYEMFPDYESWSLALSCGATIILDRGEQLEDIRVNAYKGKGLGLRLNSYGYLDFQGITQRSQISKMGMSKEELFATAKRAADRGYKNLGIYLTPGKEFSNPGALAQCTRKILEVASELQREHGILLRWCHIGGDIYRCTKETPVDYLPKEASGIEVSFGKLVEKWPDLAGMALVMEVGQHIAIPAGVVIAKIQGIRNCGTTYAYTDFSCVHLPDAVKAGRHYHVSRPGKLLIEDRNAYRVAGCLPDAKDELVGNHVVHPLKRGDLVMIHDVGAYGRASSSNFFGTLRAAEVLLDEGGYRLISRRETFDDYTNLLERNEDQK